MTLLKITIDNSVRCIPKSEQSKERDIKPETMKAVSLLRKQNRKPSQNNTEFPKNFSAGGLATLTK